MKIVQFTCAFDPPATRLKELMVEQVNIWSRLQWLVDAPEYVTDQFSIDMWREKVDDPNVHWVDWDEIYAGLGDDGRLIADQMLGMGPLQGILRMAPLVQALPSVKLEMVEVTDLVAAGYIAG